jgi:hypothetical protein
MKVEAYSSFELVPELSSKEQKPLLALFEELES